jgi:hypothetical protein
VITLPISTQTPYLSTTPVDLTADEVTDSATATEQTGRSSSVTNTEQSCVTQVSSPDAAQTQTTGNW